MAHVNTTIEWKNKFWGVITIVITSQKIIMAEGKKKIAEKKVPSKTMAGNAGKKGTVAKRSGRARPGAEYEVMRGGTHKKSKHFKENRIIMEEPEVSYTSRIRAIGNSRGVILPSQLMETAGIAADAEVVVQVKDGVIYIMEAKVSGVNTDLSTWDKQFKSALRKGAKPEKDLFEGLGNEFDKLEW